MDGEDSFDNLGSVKHEEEVKTSTLNNLENKENYMNMLES